MEFAYSHELRKVIDAVRANELYWLNIISDKRNFECHIENCKAGITCVNMDKKKIEMKKPVHFTSQNAHEHHKDCPYHPDNAENRKSKLSKGFDNTIEQNTVKFSLERPKDYFSKNNDTGSAESKLKTKREFNKDNPTRRVTNHYSISGIVSLFNKLTDNGENIDQYFVQLPKIKLNMSTLFQKVQGQSVESLSKWDRIYYGNAFVNRNGNKGFKITFNTKLPVEAMDTKSYCNIFIDKARLVEDKKNKFLLDRLESHCDSKLPNNMVYVYGRMYVNQKDDKAFITLYLKNFDFFDIRLIE